MERARNQIQVSRKMNKDEAIVKSTLIAEVMSEQELSIKHLQKLHQNMSIAIINSDLQSLVEMASEMEMVASKHAMDAVTIDRSGRYGKR